MGRIWLWYMKKCIYFIMVMLIVRPSTLCDMTQCRNVEDKYADAMLNLQNGYNDHQNEAINTCKPTPARTNAPKELLNKSFFIPYVEEPPEPRLFCEGVKVLAAALPTGVMPFI